MIFESTTEYNLITNTLHASICKLGHDAVLPQPYLYLIYLTCELRVLFKLSSGEGQSSVIYIWAN